jgi:hypothetical protein
MVPITRTDNIRLAPFHATCRETIAVLLINKH